MELSTFLAEAAELLAVPSTADRPEQLHRALQLAIDAAGPGVTVERFESNGKPSALLYAGTQRPKFRVILNAHLDVVPAGPDQFLPRREGHRLYARGAHDMKVAALAEVHAFRELAGRLPYPLGLQLVTDEEVGGRDGTLHQVERGVRGRFVVIGEQSGLEIVADSKGLLNARLRANGRAGHSAYPWLGDNALVRLIRAVEGVLARYPVPDEEAWRTTVNVARMETDNRAFNQIPASAEAMLDIRFPAEDGDFRGRTAAEIEKHLGALCGPGVEVIVDRVDPPHHADRANPDIEALRQAVRRHGYRADFLRKHGAGDGRFYYQLGIDAVAFGIGGSGQHGPDEYVDITTIEPYYNSLIDFLSALA